jgi:hypothetical protein
MLFEGKNIFELWEEGAKELEKTGIGKVITAPVRLPEAVFTATKETVAQAPKIAKTLPVILIILAAGAAAYLVFAGRKGVKILP